MIGQLRRASVLCFFLSTALQVYAQPVEPYTAPWAFEEARQFDFWIGEWDVNNRFLQDDGSWVEGGTTQAEIYRILDGKAILEFWDGQFRSGTTIRGFSLRYFDTDTQKWQLALNWPGPNSPGFSELSGAFRHGRGEFYSRNTDAEGNEILTRYTFSDITPTSLRWDNGRSTDGGKSWAGTWIMEFSRTADHPAWASPDQPFHTYHDGSRCTGPEARQFDALVGTWEGAYAYRQGDAWVTAAARAETHQVLDGCGLFSLVAYETGETAYKQFQLRSYVPGRDAWVVLHLDNQPGTGYIYESGQVEQDAIILAMASDAPAERLTRTTWTTLEADTLRYELGESTDGGTTWTTTARVDLKRTD